MNLREQAELDLGLTLEDDVFGFGVECQIEDPAGTSDTFIVQSGDIHQLLETDTGVPVNNKTAHVSIRIQSLLDKAFGLPQRQPDESGNIWQFTFKDSNGISRKFTIAETLPDKTLGVISVILESLKIAT